MNVDTINEINSINNINSIILENNNISQNFVYKNSFSLLALNIRSIRLHFDELSLFLESNNCDFDVIVLSETWLAHDFKFILNGYQSINSISNFNKSDGVTILIKEQVNLINVRDNIISNCNSLELKFKINNSTYTILGIYKSPNDNVDLFISDLELYLINNTNNNLNKFIICGDINIDISNTSVLTTEYQNILSFNGFVPCVNNFTRSVNNSNSCIDHILTKNVETKDISSYIIKCNITDHYATALFIKNNSSIKD